MTQIARRIVLAARPDGVPRAANFRLEETTLPDPGPGEMLVRVIWLSLDPYMRGRMDAGKSYAAPVEVGAPMPGGTVAEVVASRNDAFAPGDVVLGSFGWVSHAVSDGSGVRKLDTSAAPMTAALGALGMPGFTAWTGLTRIAEAKEGETAEISAATGAVGAVAAQIAKARGLRVIGVAGGTEKCAWAVEEMGIDACIDHRAMADGKAMAAAIREAAPDGVDVYFENVGGKTTVGSLHNMNVGGRIALCGMVAWYSGENLGEAMHHAAVWRAILSRRLTVRGFIISDHWDAFPEFLSEAGPMVADGRIRWRESVAEGLESAPAAFLAMLGGGNFGKQLVRVGPDP